MTDPAADVNLTNATTADVENARDHDHSVLIVRDFHDENTAIIPLDYHQTHERMLHFTQNRDEDSQDEIWLLQHQRVFTQGQAGKPEHVLFAGDIPVVQSDRGGQVTYHGPGQLIVYLMIDIKRKGWGPRELVSAIEDAIVATLKDFGIDSAPKKRCPWCLCATIHRRCQNSLTRPTYKTRPLLSWPSDQHRYGHRAFPAHKPLWVRRNGHDTNENRTASQ